ncbi:hypothetical protein HanPI659440_Chr14g0546311 [Helianthus annuus]|nr:hypothetical protein HanPI659440_Chr14g0546311 [Helianthus annuus]
MISDRNQMIATLTTENILVQTLAAKSVTTLVTETRSKKMITNYKKIISWWQT